MNTQEKIEAAGKKKEEGNVLFKAGKYERASKRYEKVNNVVDEDVWVIYLILHQHLAHAMRLPLLYRQ